MLQTGDVTTGHVTTGDVTTGDVTTGDVTTGDVTNIYKRGDGYWKVYWGLATGDAMLPGD